MSGSSSPQGHISRLRPRHPPLAAASSLFRNVTVSCGCSPWCPHHTAGRSSTGTRHCCARSGFSTLRTRATPARHDGVSPTRPRHASECSRSSSNSTVRLVRRRTRTVGLHGLDSGGHASASTGGNSAAPYRGAPDDQLGRLSGPGLAWPGAAAGFVCRGAAWPGVAVGRGTNRGHRSRRRWRSSCD